MDPPSVKSDYNTLTSDAPLSSKAASTMLIPDVPPAYDFLHTRELPLITTSNSAEPIKNVNDMYIPTISSFSNPPRDQMVCYFTHQAPPFCNLTLPPAYTLTDGAYQLCSSMLPTGTHDVYSPYFYPSNYPSMETNGPRQQLQSPVIVDDAGQERHIYQPAGVIKSYAGHISLACFVFWGCGVIFGLVALILAVIARSLSKKDPATAHRVGRASITVSISGIILFVLLISVVIIVGITCNRDRERPHSSEHPGTHQDSLCMFDSTGTYVCQ